MAAYFETLAKNAEGSIQIYVSTNFPKSWLGR